MNAIAPIAIAANDANLVVALRLAAHGLPVFPCKPDKSPYTPNGYKDAATDELAIRRWWKQHPDAMPGISCQAAGLVVIDCDVREGINGVAELVQIAVDDGLNLNASPSVLTQNKGAHCYFRAPPGFEASNKTGSLPKGLDVRSAGYVIAPGAVLPDGRRYVADTNTPDLAEAYKAGTIPTLPDKLRARIEAGKHKEAAPAPVPATVAPSPVPAPQPSPGAATARERAYAEQALRKAAADLASRGPGTGRNGALNTAALAMGELVGAGWISRGAVEEALRDASRRNGYADKDGEDAVARTLQSGLQAGIAKPRTPLAATDPPMVEGVAALVAGQRAAFEAGKGAAPGQAAAVAPQVVQLMPIAATPFDYIDPDTIPKREWLYGRHYIRKFVSATVAPGGVGKSILAITEAVAMASGRKLIGHAPGQPLNVWLYNGEDPKDELQRRVSATMLKHGLQPDDMKGKLYVNSGRDTPLVIATHARDGTIIHAPVIDAIIAEIIAKGIDVLIIDPFVSCHNVPESDNGAIDSVVKAWNRVADVTGCAIELIHHARKGNGAATGVDDARGASALVSAARSVRLLNPMADDQAKQAGVDTAERKAYVCITNGKANLTTANAAGWWFKLASFPLPNGDDVGVVEGWRWPASASQFEGDMIDALYEVLRGGEYRYDRKAKDWVGYHIGQIFSYDKTSTNAIHRKAMVEIIDDLISEGWMQKVKKRDTNS